MDISQEIKNLLISPDTSNMQLGIYQVLANDNYYFHYPGGLYTLIRGAILEDITKNPYNNEDSKTFNYAFVNILITQEADLKEGKRKFTITSSSIVKSNTIATYGNYSLKADVAPRANVEMINEFVKHLFPEKHYFGNNIYRILEGIILQYQIYKKNGFT